MPALAHVTTRLAVIGCGNPNRSDDGVGPEVIAMLRDAALPPGVEVFDAGTDGMGVIYRARGMSHLIVVDARAPEGEPGTVYDVPGDVLEQAPPQGFSLHDFRWDHALYAGRRTYGEGFPQHVRVFLIEAQSLELAIGLSDSVRRGAIEVCGRITCLAHDFAGGRWA